MSNRLFDEVRDYTPNDLTTAELLLLLCVAHRAQDEDRLDAEGKLIPARCWSPGMQELARLMRMTERGVGSVLRRLEHRRGFRVRVPFTTDKFGRPVYATKGHSTVYRVPEFSKVFLRRA
jgi:hypothetical protein